MAKSRHKRGKTRTNPRSTYSGQKASASSTKVVILSIVLGLTILAVAYLLMSGGGNGEVTTKSGLKYTDLVIGTGASPREGQAVTVHYTGTLEDGTKFDSSVDKGQPMTFRPGVQSMVPGFVEGLMTMKVGGKRKVIIPPELGYGAEGNPDAAIPPNATLIFELELLRAQ